MDSRGLGSKTNVEKLNRYTAAVIERKAVKLSSYQHLARPANKSAGKTKRHINLQIYLCMRAIVPSV